MYQVVIERHAVKQIAKISSAQIPVIQKAISELADNPRPKGYKKLKGTKAFRVRSGDYRIIYEIHEKIITIVVIDFGHRKDIYTRLR